MGLETNNLYKDDCVPGLGKIVPGSVDLLFADPPFNIGYEYDTYDDNRDRRAYLDWSRSWMAAAARTCSDQAAFWIAIGDEYAAELKMIATEELNLTCRSWVIWYYTFGVNCVRNFSRSHTHLLYFVKDKNAFTFNADDPDARIPSARQLVYGDKRANPDGRLPDNTWILRPQDLEYSFAPTEDTWHLPRICGTFKERAGWHGCQMPEQLLGRIIRLCSNPGDLVVDPFGGSGTTLVVAHKLARRWIGFEISDTYAARIQKRLETIKPGDPLEGGTSGAPANGPPRPRPQTKRATPEATQPLLDCDWADPQRP